MPEKVRFIKNQHTRNSLSSTRTHNFLKYFLSDTMYISCGEVKIIKAWCSSITNSIIFCQMVDFLYKHWTFIFFQTLKQLLSLISRLTVPKVHLHSSRYSSSYFPHSTLNILYLSTVSIPLPLTSLQSSCSLLHVT